MAFKRFEDIQAWQRARELVNAVYGATQDGAFSRDFGLKDQIRRAAVSVMLNIAEGSSRQTDRDFAGYLTIARGSAAEVQAAAYVALDQGYLEEQEFKKVYGLAEECSKMLNALSSHLRSAA